MADNTQRLADYLQACFAWEFSNVGGQNILSKSLRGRRFLSIDTLFSGLARTPDLTSEASQALAATLKKHARSSDLWCGVFLLQAQFSKRRFQGKELCAPLFIAHLSEHYLHPNALQNPTLPQPMLMVNRLALAQLLDNDVAERLGDELQKILDSGPLDKTGIGRILELVVSAIPGVKTNGFELFPLLSPQSQLASNARSDQPALTCCGVVYLSKRSRQSMGVLHELSQLKNCRDFSVPITHLVEGRSRTLAAAGPLNVIGALSSPQRKAIMAARQHSLSVVHGPPGTGKTHVLAMLAADQIANGQSVLICTRNNAAIDVIEKVVCERLNIEEAVVRGGSFQHLRQLKSRITQILQQGKIGFKRQSPAIEQGLRDTGGDEVKALSKLLRKTTKELSSKDRDLSRLSRKIGAHVAAEEGRASLTYKISSFVRSVLGMKKSPLLIAQLTERWRQLQELREAEVIKKLQIRIQLSVAQVLRHQRSELTRFARSVTAQEHNQRSLQIATDYNAITQTLPLWMSSLADLSHILPLQKELFDLLIIDEASQADIASVLPALHRAKRVVIIGDTQQLRHVSFLPREVESKLLKDAQLSAQTSPSFRRESILDWTNRQIETSAASSFLDEHFRSQPPIIDFSNREFYANQLKLLTHVRRRPSMPALELVEVEDATRSETSGANRKEAGVVVEYLAKLIASLSDTERAPSAEDELSSKRSIGVISPFRAQVDLLDKLISRQFDDDVLRSVDFIVGTAHELQGEERDIVLFSSCIDQAASGGSLTFLSRPDVLNVSVTRAKHQQIVFLSRRVEQLDGSTLFGRYINHVKASTGNFDEVSNRDSEQTSAVRNIVAELNANHCEIKTNVEIGSSRLDLLLTVDGCYLGIDLIGFGGADVQHGLHQHELELLYRLNIPIVQVTARDWHVFRPQVIAHINERLAAMTGSDL